MSLGNLDWLTFRPAGVVDKTSTYVQVPVFSYTGLTYKGSSEIITQFNFSASKNFVLKNLPTRPAAANYCLCIRYRVGSTVYRWKLWADVGEVLNAPLYQGEVIKKNFVLECWSVKDATTCVNATAINIITSVVSVPTNFRSLGSTALATGTEVPYTAVALALTTESTANFSPSHRWRADLFDGGIGWIPTTGGSGSFGFSVHNSGASTQDPADANINNKPTVITSSNHSLTNSTLAATNIVAFYFVFQQTNWSNGNIIYDCNSFRLTQSGSSGDIVATWKDDGSTTCTINVPVSTTSHYLLLVIRASGSSTIAYYNLSGGGAVDVDSVATALTTFNVSNSYIGRYNGVTASSSVRWTEIMMFTLSDIVAGNLSGISNYVLSRYVEQFLALNATIPSGNQWIDNE